MGNAFALALVTTLGLGFLRLTDRLDLGWGFVLAPVILWTLGGALRIATSWMLVGVGALALKTYEGRLEAVYGGMRERLSDLSDDEVVVLLAYVTEEVEHRIGLSEVFG